MPPPKTFEQRTLCQCLPTCHWCNLSVFTSFCPATYVPESQLIHQAGAPWWENGLHHCCNCCWHKLPRVLWRKTTYFPANFIVHKWKVVPYHVTLLGDVSQLLVVLNCLPSCLANAQCGELLLPTLKQTNKDEGWEVHVVLVCEGPEANNLQSRALHDPGLCSLCLIELTLGVQSWCLLLWWVKLHLESTLCKIWWWKKRLGDLAKLSMWIHQPSATFKIIHVEHCDKRIHQH